LWHILKVLSCPSPTKRPCSIFELLGFSCTKISLNLLNLEGRKLLRIKHGLKFQPLDFGHGTAAETYVLKA
jgi:hypothetical protein